MEPRDERQNLLDRLHDAVKQCQVRFGGKNELATESDSRVSCLLNQLEAILQHGMKRSRSRTSAFRQVSKVTGIMKQDPEAVFWHLIKEHLGNLEEDQFNNLPNVHTDTGRGRSWLRSALNEQTLERFVRQIIGNKRLLGSLYEKEAFLLDEERASMLPTMAAGLSSILFALNIDSEELNVVKQAPTAQPFTKDVLNTLLPPFVPKQPADEPAPVYSGEVTEGGKAEKKKKKKKKKVLTAAIVSIEDDGNEESEQRTEPEGQEKSSPAFQEPKLSSPIMNDSFDKGEKSDTSTESYSLQSSTCGAMDSGKDNIGLPSDSKDADGGDEASLMDSSGNIATNLFTDKIGVDPSDRKLEAVSIVEPKANFSVGVADGGRDKPSNQDESDEVANFNFGHQSFFHTVSRTSRGGEDRPGGVPAFSSKERTQGQENQSDLTNPERWGFGGVQDNYERRTQADTDKDGRVSPSNNMADHLFVESSTNSEQIGQEDCLQLPSNDSTKSLDIKAYEDQAHATVPNGISQSAGAKIEPYNATLELRREGNGDGRDNAISPAFAVFREETATSANFTEHSPRHSPSPCDSPVGSEISEGGPAAGFANDMESESQSDPIVVLDTGESLVPVIITVGDSKELRDSDNLRDGDRSFRDSCDNSPGLLGDRADTSSLSSASWSWVEDPSDVMPASKPEQDASSESGTELLRCGAGEAALAALDACSDAQRGMSHLISALSAAKAAAGDVKTNEYSSKNDGVNNGDLKQALVTMMLRKDEAEEQNSSLRHLLGESRSEVEQLKAEMEQSKDDLKMKTDKDSRKIEALKRENELLKHQLKKYVGAVQMMRSDRQGSQSRAEALAGIRQDEVLPNLPEQKNMEREESEKAEEYKEKLIQVSEMHGELLEFNERLHKQVNAHQLQIRRLRQELINLRGPLPEDTEEPADVARLGAFDPSVMAVNSRPLINVWIPSAFLRGRSSGLHHVYQLYVRIQDDEWNVYRRYSHFHDFYKKVGRMYFLDLGVRGLKLVDLAHSVSDPEFPQLRRKYSIVGTFKFPPKKTIGNKDLQFVDSRRRLLQDYLRRVVNMLVTSEPRLANCRDKAAFLKALPFFGDQFTSEKGKSAGTTRRKRSLQYTGL